MAQFNSKGGAWYPENQAAKDLLKEKGFKVLGKVPATESVAKAVKPKKKGKKK